MKASMRDGLADLSLASVQSWSEQFNDTIVRRDINDTTTELMSKLSQGLEMLMFMSKCLRRSQNSRMERSILNSRTLKSASYAKSPYILRLILNLILSHRFLSMMSNQFMKMLRSQDRNLRQQQFPFHDFAACIIQDNPDRN